jgi:[acyl-carrier-protein] S-malonyltransferase
MKKAFIFPGQASQFPGMGKDMYEHSALARSYFDRANEILGFSITDVMFEGTEDQLKETRMTQPAVFLHSVIRAFMAGDRFAPDAVAGHSLGEFSALVAAGAITFEDGLRLVYHRASAMQEACEATPSTMAAIMGMEDTLVEQICNEVNEIVVAANYNCPGQLVISGSLSGVEEAVRRMTESGARSAVILKVGGAFHSPLMAPAADALASAIQLVNMLSPRCPVYQNVDANPYIDTDAIRSNLLKQLTSPVRWTQTIQNMISDGIEHFTEVGGTGKVLRGFVARVNRQIPSETLEV